MKNNQLGYNLSPARVVCVIFCLLFAICLLSLGCGSQSTETTTTTTTTGTGTTTTTTSTTTTTAAGGATISGQVGAITSDLAAAGVQSFTIVPLSFRTLANTGVADATVRVISVDGSGNEIDMGLTATTDASGNYTIHGVPPSAEGIYRIVATKPLGADTLQVSSLAIIDTITNETVNVAPETTIADKMFEGIIKNEYGVDVVVNKDTMEELKYMVVDDTDNLVNDTGRLALPSMLQSRTDQVVLAAGGIGDNRGNAQKALEKIDNENLIHSAKENQSLSSAKEAINKMTANGLGGSYIPAEQANQAFGQALLDGQIKTAGEIIAAVNNSTMGGTPPSTAEVIASLEAQFSTIERKIDNIISGAAPESITEPEFYAFTISERRAGVTSTTTLDVIQQITLKNFIKQNFAASAVIDDINVADRLGYITEGMHIITSSPSIDDYNIYYGYYGVKRINGSASVRIPSAYTGVTINSVSLMRNGSVEGSMTAVAAGSTEYYFDVNHGNYGPTVEAGHTYTYTLLAALSNGLSPESSVITVEVIEIPEPTLSLINDMSLERNSVQYYPIPCTTDIRPILVWSTNEVAGILPSGYSWGYAIELNRIGTKTGAATLEIDELDSTNVYNSGTDLGSLFTNAAFLCPVDLTSEVSGEKVCYQFRVQRIMLNSLGKYNGIAAGANGYLRYAP